jgi:hypothetical protein
MYGVQAKGFAGLTISRTHGIQQRLPITLPASLHAPSPSGTCYTQTRLARMVKLYRCIDGTFIDLWNGVRCQADPSWVHELQMSLHELAPNRIGCTEGQAADIVVAQYWLRAAVWQLCSSRGLLGGFTNESVLFFSASCIAKDLQLALVGLPHFAVQARGGNLVSLFVDQSGIHLAFYIYTPLRIIRRTNHVMGGIADPLTACFPLIASADL